MVKLSADACNVVMMFWISGSSARRPKPVVWVWIQPVAGQQRSHKDAGKASLYAGKACIYDHQTTGRRPSHAVRFQTLQVPRLFEDLDYVAVDQREQALSSELSIGKEPIRR